MMTPDEFDAHKRDREKADREREQAHQHRAKVVEEIWANFREVRQKLDEAEAILKRTRHDPNS